MQGDDPTGHRPGGPAPGGPGAGADTVLAALAHRLRARSERQQLLTERLRSGELRPGALADLAELAAAARRGIRDGDHILVMAGVPGPDHAGGGPVSLGQALSAAVGASEAASRTVVPPTPSVSLEPSAVPVFAQILAELLAHATAATAPGERLELHTRWGPDGGLVLELLSPRPVPTRTPVDDLDRMLTAGAPEGPVAPQEIGLFLAARLARAIGGRLGLRGSPGVASAPGPSPVAVLVLPPSALAGGRSGEDADVRPGDEWSAELPPGPGGEPAAEQPTGLVPTGSAGPPEVPQQPPTVAAPLLGSGPDPSVPPWPPVPAADTASANGAAADPLSMGQDGPSGPNPIARLPVPPPPSSAQPPQPSSMRSSPGLQIPPGPPRGPGDGPLPGPPPPGSGPAGADQPGSGLPRRNPGSGRLGPGHPGPDQLGAGHPGSGLPGPGDPGSGQPGPGHPATGQPGPGRPGSGQSGPGQPGSGQSGPGQSGPGLPGLPMPGSGPPAPPASGPSWPGPQGGQPGPGPWGPPPANGADPLWPSGPPEQPGPPPGSGPPDDVPPVTEALPVSGSTPPVELFGPFDSEVPVPVDDLDGTPIFAAVASAWFRDPTTPPNGAVPGTPAGGTNGHRAGQEPANWTSAGDAEFEAARSRADRPVEPPVNANGLPMRRPGQQMVPPARRDSPPPAQRAPGSAERQPDRVRNRLASYQRGLREGRHRAAEESSGQSAGAGMNGATPHGRNGHAAG